LTDHITSPWYACDTYIGDYLQPLLYSISGVSSPDNPSDDLIDMISHDITLLLGSERSLNTVKEEANIARLVGEWRDKTIAKESFVQSFMVE
jgi:hypothetical protein